MQPAERPPILPYCRVPIVVHGPNAAAPEVARRVAELIAARRPGAVAEHIGSSAVPGLAGKGTVDLLLPTPAEDSPEVAALRGFRDALLADPGLRRQYEQLKRTIVGAGTVDSVAFSKAKHAWIVATLERLGLTEAVEEVKTGGLP
jgi:GrpB-like predicted nucleotidyltransferase (UPF0157 family)